MQAFLGGAFAVAGLGQLGSDDGLGDLAGWTQFGLGLLLVAAMVIVGLRVALGEELGPSRSLGLLVGSLFAGVIGVVLMAAATTS
jgi:hypothetical protein